MSFTTDIVVIGGGPAGMTAAISAAQKRGVHVTLVEHGPRVGKKLLSTGNGRCNLTNLNMDLSRYHGDSGFCQSVLNRYPPSVILTFFSNLGLICTPDEEGRVYPYSNQASSVLDILRRELQEKQVSVCCDCAPQSIQKKKSGFVIHCSDRKICTKTVVFATGGKAAPSSGSDGSGYALLSQLGHSVTSLYPALTQIKTDPQLTRPVKGMRSIGSVSLVADGSRLRQEQGEIQFSDGALSGICVFQLSRYAAEWVATHKIDGTYYKQAAISLDLLPGQTVSSLQDYLSLQAQKYPSTPLEQFLAGILNKRVGQAVLKQAGLAPLSRLCGSLSPQDFHRIAATIKDWKFPILGVSPWSQAQVTAGGVPCSEFDEQTLESKLIPGLYAAGELLNIDGDCGGYNLQWAWSSGLLAGISAANAVIKMGQRGQSHA